MALTEKIYCPTALLILSSTTKRNKTPISEDLIHKLTISGYLHNQELQLGNSVLFPSCLETLLFLHKKKKKNFGYPSEVSWQGTSN